MSIRTTAINKANVAVTMQSGKVGNVRYIQRNGETYVRAAYNKSKVSTVSDSAVRWLWRGMRCRCRFVVFFFIMNRHSPLDEIRFARTKHEDLMKRNFRIYG